MNKIHEGDEINSLPPSEENSPNNIEVNNLENKKEYKVFVKPSLDEVKAYCLERNKGVDAEKWYNHYSANGWMVGRTKMVDWKAAVRTWERSDSNGKHKSGNFTPYPDEY